MKKTGMYFIIVAVDESRDKIVASTTLFLEYKFIHGNAIVSYQQIFFTHSLIFCQRGRIEDVVVDESARGKRLGKLVVKIAIALAKKLKCYKLSLDCRDEIIPFYTSLGFTAPPGRANMLVIRFEEETAST
jgi:glucosamine-phosphate N-acetyltransferase